jgi:geranylgeranyl reductase family protein
MHIEKKSAEETRFDIVIIGGGPTGSVCAIRLKQLNPSIKVCIVDRKKFPRDKACGDGLGPGVHKIINDLGLISILDKREPIERLVVSSPGGYELNAELPKMGEIKPLGFVVPRLELDNELITEARNLGVILFEEFELIGFSDNGFFKTELVVKKQDTEIILSTKLLIGADGARSKLRRLLNIPYNSDKHTGIATRHYCELEDYNEMLLRLDFLKEINPGYGWVFPVNSSYANIGVGIDVHILKKRGLNMDEMLESYLHYLKQKMKIKVLPETKLNYILPYGSEMPALVNQNNKVLIGDSASMINPFTGEGIYYGMYAGNSLAENIYDKLNDHTSLQRSLIFFETGFKKKFRKHYKINNTTKHLMNSPFANLAIRASKRDPEILKQGIELMMGDRRSINPLNLAKIFMKGFF